MKITKNLYISLILAIFVVLGAVMIAPAQAHAFLPFFGGNDGGFPFPGGDFGFPFPGGDNDFGGFPFPFPDPVGVPIPVPYPDFGGGGCGNNCGYTPPPLSVSCYPMPLSIPVGGTATWAASANGGSGHYVYSWSGSDNLAGSGSMISKSYYNAGTKSATVTVNDGKKSKSAQCNGSVHVFNDHQPTPSPTPNPGNNNNSNSNHNYNYNYNYNTAAPIAYNYPQYPYPDYDYHYPYPGNLSVSCSASPTYVQRGDRVNWSAYASGGRGNYTYRWTGTDGLNDRGQHITMRYNNPGIKYAWVTVTSDGQTATQMCYNSVNVGGNTPYPHPTIYPTPYPYPQNELDIACIADPKTARVNQPVNWTAEVVGGYGPYTYTWSGTDNLTGNAANIIKYYSTSGTKSAVVSVRSADGRTGTRACSNTVTVTSGAAKKPTPTPTPAPCCYCANQPCQYQPGKEGGAYYGQPYQPQPYQGQPVQPTYNPQQGSQPQVIYVMPDGRQVYGPAPTETQTVSPGLFSVRNIPWGLVATLIILVLFFTVVYLIFNRTKI